ncbi:hypothetical protein AGLY_001163 [Aphis glycines]|uniref:Uncharacterized protein n=1 Tax=Aphis glycines TaxID=307491 RepID=A0A6G0UA26_APHGL|nr:hypothetical protein AGLY_001163 [Aphis glycines]
MFVNRSSIIDSFEILLSKHTSLTNFSFSQLIREGSFSLTVWSVEFFNINLQYYILCIDQCYQVKVLDQITHRIYHQLNVFYQPFSLTSSQSFCSDSFSDKLLTFDSISLNHLNKNNKNKFKFILIKDYFIKLSYFHYPYLIIPFLVSWIGNISVSVVKLRSSSSLSAYSSIGFVIAIARPILCRYVAQSCGQSILITKSTFDESIPLAIKSVATSIFDLKDKSHIFCRNFDGSCNAFISSSAPLTIIYSFMNSSKTDISFLSIEALTTIVCFNFGSLVSISLIKLFTSEHFNTCSLSKCLMRPGEPTAI